MPSVWIDIIRTVFELSPPTASSIKFGYLVMTGLYTAYGSGPGPLQRCITVLPNGLVAGRQTQLFVLPLFMPTTASRRQRKLTVRILSN